MLANVDCSVCFLLIVLADVIVALTVVVLSIIEEVLKECRRLALAVAVLSVVDEVL